MVHDEFFSVFKFFHIKQLKHSNTMTLKHSKPRIDGFAFEGEDAEDAFVDAA